VGGAVELRLDPFAIDYDCSATFVSSPLMMTGGQSATRTGRELDRLSSAPSRTGKVALCCVPIAPVVPKNGRGTCSYLIKGYKWRSRRCTASAVSKWHHI